MIWKLWEKPEFKDHAEESMWWTSLQDKFLHAMKEAEADGSLGRGGVARRLGLAPGSGVTLDPEDAEMAKRQAAARKMPQQEYVRVLIHQALKAREP